MMKETGRLTCAQCDLYFRTALSQKSCKLKPILELYFMNYLVLKVVNHILKGPCLPLEVVWLLHKDCIVSFDTYLAW